MKKIESITAAAFILATSILLSRVLGYLREMLLAYKFGASATTDAFYAAFQIPDLLNYFLAGGALSIAFIPLYNKVLVNDGEDAARNLTTTVMGTLGLLAVVATAALSYNAEELVRFQFPRFDDHTRELTVQLTRIVLPAQIFFIIGGIAQAVLMAHKDFRAAALSPLIYNICIIAGGFFLYNACGIAGFAFGTLAGSLLGPFLMPLIFSRGLVPLKARISPRDKTFLIYLAMAAPLMFGQTLLTLDEWYGRWFGALLPAGSVAYISFARRLMQVPIAVIGQAVAAAALPTLSRLWAEKKVDELNRTMQATLQTGLSLSVFAGAKIFVLAVPLVTLVYQHGAFSTLDTGMVAMLLMALCFAVPGWILQQISVRAFYARSDTWRPMVLGTLLSIAVVPLYLKLGNDMGIKGLAFASAIGMTVNAFATLVIARRLHAAPDMAALGMTLLRSLAIALPAAAVGLAALHSRMEYLPLDLPPKIDALVNLAVGGIAFALVAMPGIFWIGDAGVRDFTRKIIRKVAR